MECTDEYIGGELTKQQQDLTNLVIHKQRDISTGLMDLTCSVLYSSRVRLAAVFYSRNVFCQIS
jgi:hypothetical protein